MLYSGLPITLCICLTTGFFYSVSPVFSEEIYFSFGVIDRHEDGQQAYSWQISYLEGLSEHFAWSFSWLNEGHLPHHHRDGPAVQLWVRKNILNRRLSIAMGVGPYLGFDTDTEAASSEDYKNEHDLGGLFSLSSTWHTGNRWLLQARIDNVWMDGKIDTTSFSAGIGYQLKPSGLPGPLAAAQPESEMGRETKNEINAFLGYTVINGPLENDFAAAIEYRRSITRYLDWTVGWLHEIDSQDLDRQGIVTQIWPTRTFFDNRLALGVGLGIYLFSDDRRKTDSGNHNSYGAAGLATLALAYRLSRKFHIRTSWGRVVTDYDRDSDIFLVGVGYRF